MVSDTSPRRKCSQFLRFLTIILLYLPSFIFIPCFLLSLLPIYITRFIVSQLKKIFRPDLTKLVQSRSAIMAVDFWNGIGGQPKCNLIVTLCFEGSHDLETIRSVINEKLVQRREPNGEFTHPECQQYYEQWLGFTFWKWGEKFDIRNHVKLYDEKNSGKIINTKDLLRIEAEVTGSPFPNKISPWELLIIPNYESQYIKTLGQKWAAVIRFHHGLGDGYSCLNILLREVCQLYDHQIALPSVQKKSQIPMYRRILDVLLFGLRAPYELIQQQVENRDYNEWRIPESKISTTWFHAQSDPISLEYIKEIKRSNEVSFTAVMIAALTGGIRSYFIKRGRPVPDCMHCLAPFPLLNRKSTKMRNFYSYAFLKFPVHLASPKQRLLTVHKNLKHLRRSTTPVTNSWQIPLAGGLFSAMIKPLAKNVLSTAIMSNFPGPNEKCSFLGNEVIEMGYMGGVVHGDTGLGFTMLSYFGTMTIRARGTQSIFPTEAHIDDLMKEICLEFDVLKKIEEV